MRRSGTPRALFRRGTRTYSYNFLDDRALSSEARETDVDAVSRRLSRRDVVLHALKLPRILVERRQRPVGDAEDSPHNG